jgi:hypothetical protein
MTLGGDVEIEMDRGGLMVQLSETQGRLTNLRNARRRDENLNDTLFVYCNAVWQDERNSMIKGYKEAMELRDRALHFSRCAEADEQKVKGECEVLKGKLQQITREVNLLRKCQGLQQAGAASVQITTDFGSADIHASPFVQQVRGGGDNSASAIRGGAGVDIEQFMSQLRQESKMSKISQLTGPAWRDRDKEPKTADMQAKLLLDTQKNTGAGSREAGINEGEENERRSAEVEALLQKHGNFLGPAVVFGNEVYEQDRSIALPRVAVAPFSFRQSWLESAQLKTAAQLFVEEALAAEGKPSPAAVAAAGEGQGGEKAGGVGRGRVLGKHNNGLDVLAVDSYIRHNTLTPLKLDAKNRLFRESITGVEEQGVLVEGKKGEREVKVVIDWSDVTVQGFPQPFESSAGVCANFLH